MLYDRIRATTALAPDPKRADAAAAVPGCAGSAIPAGAQAAAPLPSFAEIRLVEVAALSHAASDLYFRTLLTHEDHGRAVLAAVRAWLAAGAPHRARAHAQLLASRPESALVGDVAMALVADAEHVPETAWTLLNRHDRAAVLALAPADYVRAAYRLDPVAALDAAATLLAADPGAVPPADWLAIAQVAFLGRDEDVCAQALDRAGATDIAAAAAGDAEPDAEIARDIAWLRSWLGRAEAARRPVETPPSAVPFAVLDYTQPDRRRTSRNLGDHLQSVAALGHLARRSGLRFSGEDGLVDLVAELAERVPADRRIDGDDAELALYRVDRDASSLSAVPDGTWVLAFGWHMHSQFALHYDFPLNERLRPIYVSVHINRPAMLTPAVLAHFREHGPIGCRDWSTTHLLLAAGVPAFFSGCLTTTIDTVLGTLAPTLDADVHVDVAAPAAERSTDIFSQMCAEVTERPFAANARDAIARLETYCRRRRIVTSRLHTYLPARSVGARVDFRPRNGADGRFNGLAGITDDEFDGIRRGLNHKLDEVLTAVAAGKGREDVAALWRDLCAPAVALAQARRSALGQIPPPSLDVAGACAAVRAAAATIKPSAPPPAGPEVAIELSLDGNLKHQLAVVLESVVAAASRPIRAYVLSRDHGPADHDRLAALFPEVAFVWLPMDDVDYGPVLGMLPHITVATMDRLLLPELLPDVPRIVHLDLDLVVVADIAELFDTDLAGQPLAARSSLQRHVRSGFAGLAGPMRRLAATPAAAWEYVERTHTRHAFDFAGFNAGVLVLDLDRMRADDFCRQFLPWVERFGLNDQEVLNAYAGRDRAVLDPRWNRFARLEPAEDAHIVHWAGAPKPWRAEYVARRGLWREVEARLHARAPAAGP